MVRALTVEPKGLHTNTIVGADVERKIGDWLVCYLEEREPKEISATFGELLEAGSLTKAEGRTRRHLGGSERGRQAARRWARIEVRRFQSVVVARLLDSLLIKENVIEELAEELDDLLRAGNRRVVLNFARVERMSSQIVGVVVNAHRRCAEGPGGLLKVCGLQPQVADIFALAGLTRSVSIHPDESAAVGSPWPRRPGPRPLPLSILAALADPQQTLKSNSTNLRVDPADPYDPQDQGPRGPFVWLVVEFAPESGPPRGTVIPVRGDCFLIGHGEECQLRLAGQLVGRRHAAIERCGNRVLVSDLGSECGSAINGRPLVGSSAVLKHGDRVRFGPLSCAVAIGNDPARPPGIDDLVASWVGDGASPAADDSASFQAPPEPMTGHRVAFELIEGVLVITPKLNRLDHEVDAERLREGLAEVFDLALSNKVVLKLNHVTHVSSHGLGVILAFFLRLTRAGGSLRLCEIHSRVLSVLEQFRLPVLLEIRSTVEDAVLSGWD